MKKIFMSILAIALTVSAVSGTAYALFTDTVQVAGIQMTSGNADLKIQQINDDGTPNTGVFNDSLTVNQTLENLYPNQTIPFQWVLKNDSASVIPLRVFAQMNSVSDVTGYGGSWEALKTHISMRVYSAGIIDTGFHTLNEWYSTGHLIGNITHGNTVTYDVTFKVDDATSIQIANKAINGVGFLLTGTQY